MINKIRSNINKILNGDPSPLYDFGFICEYSDTAMKLYNQKEYNSEDIELLQEVIRIANIVYNNIPLEPGMVFLEDGVYDLLLERLKSYVSNFQVGAEPLNINIDPKKLAFYSNETVEWVKRLPSKEDMMFPEIYPDNTAPIFPIELVTFMGEETGKRTRIISHDNPNLVGTLDKCKCVLTSEAEKLGVLDDPDYKILERDFFEDHIKKGIINPDLDQIKICAELKYDGVSVVVQIENGIVVHAYSRGDTGMDAAVDYTPIFYGYTFPGLCDISCSMELKCEAVMTYRNLYQFCKVREYNYANGRTAIIGLTGLNDAYKYRDFITLIPLKLGKCIFAGKDIFNEITKDRFMEIEFMNLFLAKEIPLIYGIIGPSSLMNVIYMCRRFCKEAEDMRNYMGVMYDGVVFSYTDPEYIEKLGRKNFINKYQIAVKFATLKGITTLMSVSFTVGQNGVITPMAHYQPIEFLGTIHTKSSIASYSRFMSNNFKIGNRIQVEYRNDVMPYVSTPSEVEPYNNSNPNPIIEFPKVCPKCGNLLTFTEKSAICMNMECPGRLVARLANMMKKLGIKGFAEANMEKLNVTSLTELYDLPKDEMQRRLNSDIIGADLYDALNNLIKAPLNESTYLGSLGFTNISIGTWNKICVEYTLQEIYKLYKQGELYDALISIKGIGPTTAETICQEMKWYIQDIRRGLVLFNLIPEKGKIKKKIRITGKRDPELMDELCKMGYDASDASVTKDCYILLIPYEGFTSTKLSKIGPDTKVIVYDEFKKNPSNFLQ